MCKYVDGGKQLFNSIHKKQKKKTVVSHPNYSKFCKIDIYKIPICKCLNGKCL